MAPMFWKILSLLGIDAAVGFVSYYPIQTMNFVCVWEGGGGWEVVHECDEQNDDNGQWRDGGTLACIVPNTYVERCCSYPRVSPVPCACACVRMRKPYNLAMDCDFPVVFCLRRWINWKTHTHTQAQGTSPCSSSCTNRKKIWQSAQND